MKPLLLLDVDGPLNPWAAKPTQRPAGYSTHRYTRPGAQRWGKPLRVWLHPGHGPMLLTLADRFELVWCTTWAAEANTWIGPRIGLPVLPVLDWAVFGVDVNTNASATFGGAGPLHWKTRAVAEYTAGRPFVWVDDEHTAADEEYLKSSGVGRFRLHNVDPHVGITAVDIDAISRWPDPRLRVRDRGDKQERERSKQWVSVATHPWAQRGRAIGHDWISVHRRGQ